MIDTRTPDDAATAGAPAQAPGGARAPREGGAAQRGGITDARQAAADVCADLRGGDLLDPSLERRASGLDARDRRWTQELLFGMLRRRARLDVVVGDRVRGGLARLDPDLTDLLRLGAQQLLAMRSVPAYAAIAQTVELAKRRHGIGASKLANAVLRRLDRERDALETPEPADPLDALALRHSHPRWLIQRWAERFGTDATERLLAANNAEGPLIVRAYGTTSEALRQSLEEAGVRVGKAPLAAGSLLLSPGVSLTELGAFRQGLLFVQDPAATLVTDYAAVEPGTVVADLCAAPGGKALELSRRAATVIAADRSMPRLRRARENARRVRAENVEFVVSDARDPGLGAADLVLVDAPCTGTGTFRRHPDARWRLKVSDLAVMGALQRAILRRAAELVRPGGLLVYSTCSLEPEENDAQVDALLAERPEFVLEPPPAGSVPAGALDDGRLRVLPHVHGADGAFAARLRRRA